MSENDTGESPVCHRKPEINYPCEWEYKVIGTDQARLEEIIRSACKPAVPEIILSNISSSGRYYSLNATLEVKDEAMRLEIFNQLQDHPEVKMVI